tara:strand:- start:170 stop:1090 length:921 start_codon:yes stop_codon:yes gene_type:complete
MIDDEFKHKPVLINEVIESIEPADDKIYFDATFGNGGYSKKILSSSNCKVIAIDRDPSVSSKAKEFEEKYKDRFKFIESRFSQIKKVMEELEREKVNCFLFDIGVSSMQLDNANRGFSFMKDGPLDMRMSNTGKTAGELINTIDQNELADILFHYGDERNSRRIARSIINYRNKKEIKSTLELADIIKKNNTNFKSKINPATKTFQALRMFINNELEELHSGLNQALNLLSIAGKICVVTFHSLEDRMVKNFSKALGSSVKVEKVIKPSDDEVRLNPRSRSAKLRLIQKISNQNKYIPIEECGFSL